LLRRARQPETLLAQQPILTGSFAAGPAYACRRWHGSDDWLLFCTTAGSGRFGYAAGSLTTSPGELVLIPPRHLHDYSTAVAPWEFTWVHFLPRSHWLPLLDWPPAAAAGQGAAGQGAAGQETTGLRRLVLGADTAAFAAIAELLERMHDRASGHRHHRWALAYATLEEALLLADEHNPASPAHRAAQSDPRILAAADAVCRDLAAEWDVAAMAAAAGMSASRFAHRFRADLGETPRRWIERRRIERGRELLLATALPIQDIAAAVGFSDPFHFTTRFKALTGAAPRSVRQAFRAPPHNPQV
jgi:AraC family transcriptional regulator of arabinose operon